MQEKKMWHSLEKNLKLYAQYKIEAEQIKSRQEELKSCIISDMNDLGIKNHSVQDTTEEYDRKIDCVLIKPTEVIFNLNAVKIDIPTAVKTELSISLDDEEHIAAFKLKLKEYGVSDVKIRELINTTMTVHRTESVDEKTLQKKVDKGLVGDITKYATIIKKPEYIRTKITEKANV